MPAPAQKVWSSGLELAADHVSSHARSAWLDAVHPIQLTETDAGLQLHLQLPSAHDIKWIREKYGPLLSEAITEAVGRPVELVYVVDPDRKEAGRPEPPARGSRPRQPAPDRVAPAPAQTQAPSPPQSEPPPYTGLNETYLFDTFIEGDCNQLARSAALAIAESPGTAGYNPFLVYGGVGLGKTHLAQAIGNHVGEAHPDLSVFYVSSESFTSQFVQAIQQNDVAAFSNRFRAIDLLIVDDVQFFGGKEKTQEEFFHIFNALHQSGKQIVLCADRAPREIDGIEERLLSRFRWGLSADVQAPDLETRIAILQHKADKNGVMLPTEVAHYVAQHITTNIRSLEGALNRLTAFAQLHNHDIDLRVTKSALSDIIDQRVSRNVRVDDIQRVVATHFELDQDLLIARTRKRHVVNARHVAMYLSKEMTNLTLKSIGSRFGGRDHSTVIHAHRTVSDRMDVEENFRETVKRVRDQVDKMVANG